ncbi:MAG: hypothetical protein HUJ88_08565 [Fusobacterium necrophorum]|nr:hypothetical protein [Fusobacterium necrophorum]
MSKLTGEQKIEIYERRQQMETISSLSKRFSIWESNINCLLSLLQIHGYNTYEMVKIMFIQKN